MPCKPEILRGIPLFSLLDEEEAAVLAGQLDVKTFAPRQRIYRAGDPGGRAYVVVSGAVRVTSVDEDGQEVVVDQPTSGEFCGFASMFEDTPHQTGAIALEETVCLEVDRRDIAALIERKPRSGMHLLAMLGRQFHGAQQLVRLRSARNPNLVIEQETTLGERVADAVARFGGSWKFIGSFTAVLIVYTWLSSMLGPRGWDPYPFILLNLFLSMLAAIQAPVIMMSQNRQDAKDRLRGELDYQVNCRSESEIQNLARRVNLLTDKMHDMEDLMRRSETPSSSAQGGGA